MYIVKLSQNGEWTPHLVFWKLCFVDKQQYSYRANRSTVDHLVRFETFICDALTKNQ